MSELIHVEMELRAKAGLDFNKTDYKVRFPDFETAIVNAWERLKSLHPGNPLFTTMLARSDAHEKLALEAGLNIPKQFGPYHRIAVIDEGGFGVVCKGLDTRSNQWVALKFPRRNIVSNPEQLAAFQAEANRVVQLKHRGIVETKSVETHDGYIAIVQQLIVGSNLKNSIEKFNDHKEIATLIANIAEALAFANRKGIIHRDLKPANILLDDHRQPFISDFGLSLHESDQAIFPNQQCGTPPYMSPQLVEGLTANLDGRTDIWSLGVILYELLAGRRPFVGISQVEIFDQIETRDPKPLREIDLDIDCELERICLKCLEKSARNRYLTADDLADDLRHWLTRDEQQIISDNREPAIVPRGLRSYAASDAKFFNSLLPGPRDREGVPASVKFWQEFIIGDKHTDEQFPVGILYGPSGSGKSSFIKAAVLPKIADQADVLYVECTQADTEVRLLKSLRSQFPNIPENHSLTDILKGVAAGTWNREGKKILLVLDQFEQRLSVNDVYEQSQIAKALRHCNQDRLMCLLVVRDNFWLALTRFFDALELDILENRNCQAIDLFDKSHAKKVLRRLGHAYGKLPAMDMPLSESQERFVEATVNQLATNHHVVCIQLVVFAEMFKFREWLPNELESVGGVKGVGASFLDFHFGRDNSNKRYGEVRNHARKALESLLPNEEEDSGIRGALKTEQELKRDAGLANEDSKFQELLQVLDGDLRLISRTDPDFGIADTELLETEQNPGSCFQLTHDYLVPSIQSWLEQTDQQSPAARARSRFSRLSKNYSTSKDDRFLPTLMEFASVVRFARYADLDPPEKDLFRKSLLVYGRRLAMMLGVLAIVFGSFFIARRSNDRKVAESYVNFFLNEGPDSVPANRKLMEIYKPDCISILKSLRQSNDQRFQERRIRTEIGLATLGVQPGQETLQYLVDQVLASNDHEGLNLLHALSLNRETVLPMLETTFKQKVLQLQPADKDRKRWMPDLARIVVILIGLGKPDTVEEFLADDNQFIFRKEVVKAFPYWANPQTVPSNLFERVKIDKTAGTICLGYGYAANKTKRDLSPDAATEMKNSIGRNSSNFTKAAVSWAVGESTQYGSIVDDMILIEYKDSTEGSENLAVQVMSRELLQSEFREYLADRNAKKPRLYEDLKFDDRYDQFPLAGISAIDAIQFCNWKSRQAGLSPCYERLEEKFDVQFESEEQEKEDRTLLFQNEFNKWRRIPEADGFRLPSEEEWDLISNRQLIDQLTDDEQVKYIPDYAAVGTTAVQPSRSRMPNEFGLFDVFGNVSECCWFEDDNHVLKEGADFGGGNIESAKHEVSDKTAPYGQVYMRWIFRGIRLVRSVNPKASN